VLGIDVVTAPGTFRGASGRLARRILTPLRIRAIHDGMTGLGVIALAWCVLYGASADVHSYWAFSPADPYGATIGLRDAFLYSPAAALVVLPFHLLPFAAFRLLLIAVDVVCLFYLARSWAIALIALPPVLGDMASGNIHILLATAIALSFRYPAAWAFPLLSKVTPGVGLLWYAVRREWRRFWIGVAVTGGLAWLVPAGARMVAGMDPCPAVERPVPGPGTGADHRAVGAPRGRCGRPGRMGCPH